MNAPKPMLSVDEALARLLASAHPVAQVEEVDTLEAAGRVLALPQRAAIDVPSMDNSSMDGYAVRTADVRTTGARLRVAQRIPAGHVGTTLEPGTAARIFTGAPVPPGADAIVIQEQCTVDGDHVIVNHLPSRGEWIRPIGEDIRRESVILEAGTRLTGVHTGLAASVGLAWLPVYRRLRVAIFCTGDELSMPGTPLKPGGIYNSNRFMQRGLLQGLGAQFTDLGIVEDTREATRAALRRAAAEHDLIVTTGGVSVGEEDHIKPAVEAEGRLDLWQIAVKPGKPLAYGAVRRPDGSEAHFIGLPGNPVSSLVTFLLFVRPFMLRCQGVRHVAPRHTILRADFDWPRPDRRREFLRARINPEGGLDRFPNQSSAVLTSAVWADGLVDVPPGQPIARGDHVRFLPFSELLA